MAKKDSRKHVCDACGKERHSLTFSSNGDESFGFCFFCVKDAKRAANRPIEDEPVSEAEARALAEEERQDLESYEEFYSDL